MMNYLHISFLFMICKRFHIVIIATLRKMSILFAMLEHKNGLRYETLRFVSQSIDSLARERTFRHAA